GRTVLVVGHRNTVPSLVEALSGKPAPALNDSDYDQLYIVTVPASEPAKVIKANFGRASQSQPSPS
ncbi:MAG: hypothetical protein ACRD9R_20920, partial [Pyrinomonadaceae bacterium]